MLRLLTQSFPAILQHLYATEGAMMDASYPLSLEKAELHVALPASSDALQPVPGRIRAAWTRRLGYDGKMPIGVISAEAPGKTLMWIRWSCIYNEGVDTVRKIATAEFPTQWGRFQILGFEGEFDNGDNRHTETAVALVMGDIHGDAPLVRIHSQCLTGDVFSSLRCDCRQQLEMALSMIAQRGAGVLVYEQQEGRGIGLMAKLRAYALQDAGLDTVEANERLGFKADHREFLLPSEILKVLGLREVRLLSNNPDKVAALEKAGIKVIERVPCEVSPTRHAENYLKTKKNKLGHLFTSR